ncbi:hypothetical protein D030_1620B, partial [Vibrio parahaemolyticus AQ3810]
VHPTKANTKH